MLLDSAWEEAGDRRACWAILSHFSYKALKVNNLLNQQRLVKSILLIWTNSFPSAQYSSGSQAGRTWGNPHTLLRVLHPHGSHFSIFPKFTRQIFNGTFKTQALHSKHSTKDVTFHTWCPPPGNLFSRKTKHQQPVLPNTQPARGEWRHYSGPLQS